MNPKDEAPSPEWQLQPGDFYFNEEGLMVLTEQYLKRRGFCCQNGCRHCPYGFSSLSPKTKSSVPSTD